MFTQDPNSWIKKVDVNGGGIVKINAIARTDPQKIPMLTPYFGYDFNWFTTQNMLAWLPWTKISNEDMFYGGKKPTEKFVTDSIDTTYTDYFRDAAAKSFKRGTNLDRLELSDLEAFKGDYPKLISVLDNLDITMRAVVENYSKFISPNVYELRIGTWQITKEGTEYAFDRSIIDNGMMELGKFTRTKEIIEEYIKNIKKPDPKPPVPGPDPEPDPQPFKDPKKDAIAWFKDKLAAAKQRQKDGWPTQYSGDLFINNFLEQMIDDALRQESKNKAADPQTDDTKYFQRFWAYVAETVREAMPKELEEYKEIIVDREAHDKAVLFWNKYGTWIIVGTVATGVLGWIGYKLVLKWI